jgi:glycosyltransferase involved in cell wall biosynthesis
MQASKLSCGELQSCWSVSVLLESTIKPRLVFTCGREAEYVRNLLVRRALRQRFDVFEVIDDRPGTVLRRSLRLLPRVLQALRAPHDLIFTGFYGHLLTLVVSRLTRKPIVLDAFVSTWDTLCFDRKDFAPYSGLGRLAYWLDKQACLEAQHCLLDTETHKQYFVETFGISGAKISAYYVGYDQQLFYPRLKVETDGRFVVFYYGSYVPLQGVEYIVSAAKLLEAEPDIEFRIVGEGMTYPRARQLAEELCVANMAFLPAVPYGQLPDAIARASVCLGGPFGTSGKARRVIAGKTFQFLAMAKPTIVGDSPANRELFVHGDDVFMCKMADSGALASAILDIKRDASLGARLAQRGSEHCRDQFSLERQGQRLHGIVLGLL